MTQSIAVSEFIEDLSNYIEQPLSTQGAIRLIQNRNKISKNEWWGNTDKTSAINFKIRKNYYSNICQALMRCLIQANKDDLERILSVVQTEDFEDTLDTVLSRDDITPEQMHLLLTSSYVDDRTDYAMHKPEKILNTAILHKDSLNIPLILERYSQLDDLGTWRTIRMILIDKIGNRLDRIKLLSFVLQADVHQNLKADYDFLLLRAFNELSNVDIKYQIHGELSEIDKHVEKENIALIRWLLNHGAKHEKIREQFFQTIADSKVFVLFPTPNDNDTYYKDLYFIMVAMHKNRLLAIRTDNLGKSQIKNHLYRLDGCSIQGMVTEMIQSYKHFLGSSSLNKTITHLMTEGNSKCNETHINAILNRVNDDISSIHLKADSKHIVERIKENAILLLPTIVQSERSIEPRYIALTMFDNLCLVADRGREINSGIEIYQFIGTALEQQESKIVIAEMFSHFCDPSSEPTSFIRVNDLTNKLTEKLKLEKFHYIPLSSQYNENSAWCSCAKMLLFSSIYIRFLEVCGVHELAERLTMTLFKSWSHEDKFQVLNEYITYFQNPIMHEYGPNNDLLCWIYLRAKSKAINKDFIDLLESTTAITNENLSLSKENAYNTVIEILKNTFPTMSKYPQDLKEMATKITEIYLHTNKKTVDNVFREMHAFIYSGGDILQTMPFTDKILENIKAMDQQKSKRLKESTSEEQS